MKLTAYVAICIVTSAGCYAQTGRSLVNETCQRWSQCTGSQKDQSSCETSEMLVYDEVTTGCRSELDAVLSCFSDMPCDGWATSSSEKTYCGVQMNALADCR